MDFPQPASIESVTVIALEKRHKMGASGRARIVASAIRRSASQAAVVIGHAVGGAGADVCGCVSGAADEEGHSSGSAAGGCALRFLLCRNSGTGAKLNMTILLTSFFLFGASLKYDYIIDSFQ
jgi:hypothetical protein